MRESDRQKIFTKLQAWRHDRSIDGGELTEIKSDRGGSVDEGPIDIPDN